MRISSLPLLTPALPWSGLLVFLRCVGRRLSSRLPVCLSYFPHPSLSPSLSAVPPSPPSLPPLRPFLSTSVPPSPRVSVRQEKESKTLIHPLTFAIKPTEMVAIMGASGAGKSTLLDVLAQRIPFSQASQTAHTHAPLPLVLLMLLPLAIAARG